MAFNLKVYQVIHYHYQHPYYTKIEESNKEMSSQCGDDYTKKHETNLERKVMEEEVHRQFLSAENSKVEIDKKKLNLI